MAGRAGRVAQVVITATIAFGVLAGCGGSSDSSPTTTSSDQAFTPATAPGALKGPGTEIADGIHVQPGSALVATAFPNIDAFAEASEPAGWEAVVAVQGDPIEVWHAYAAELGIDDVAGAKEACIVAAPTEAPGGATKHQRFLTEPALEGEVRLACSARIGTLTASLASGAVGCVRPDVSDDPCELRSGSALYLRQDVDDGREPTRSDELGTDDLRLDRATAVLPDDGDEAEAAPVETAPVATAGDPASTTTAVPRPPDRHPGPVDIPDGPIVAPELQGSGPSNLPGGGERIDDGIDDFLGTGGHVARPAVLPEGAASLIAPAMLLDCNSGLVAVVALPQEPADAVAAFATDDPEGASEVATGEVGDRTWATRSFDSAGGFKLQLTAVSADEDGASYLLATECGD